MLVATALIPGGTDARDVDPEAPHYRFAGRFDAALQTLSARVVITLPAQAEDMAFVLGDRFVLTTVATDCGARTDVAPTAVPIAHLQRIAVRFAQARRRGCRLTLDYHGPIDEPGATVPSLSRDRIELGIDTMWLPVRQDLGMHFTIDADITGLPGDLVVLSQGVVKQTRGRLRVHRATPDNDLVLVGAPGLKRQSAADVDFWTAMPDDPLVAALRAHAFGAARYYRTLFGAPQVGPVRMVIVPRGNGAGYARRGLVVMPTFRTAGAATPTFDTANPARFVSHEFRHAWGATPSTVFADYWMSESVAEYFGLRYVEQTLGVAERDVMLKKKSAAAEKAGRLTGGKRPSGAALYQKGPLLLFALEAEIGRPALDRILISRDPPITTDAFLDRLASVAGAAIAADFKAKLDDPSWHPQ